MDKASLAARLERRIREIAARYGDRIKIWDVANEAFYWNPFVVNERMPDGHIEFAFKAAERYLPTSSTLIYNDFACWDCLHGDYTPFYMLGRHLKGLNVNLGGLGLQYHMIGTIKQLLADTPYKYNTRHILACMDQYAKIGVPLNISDVTITAQPDLGDGPAFQREVADKLYRLWFSHPASNGIIWWNLVDDTAYVNPLDVSQLGENQYKGGLLNNDLTPKPAYQALRRLIKEEWSTRVTLDYDKGGPNRFNGFDGDYEAIIKTSTGVFRKTLKLSKGSINTFKLVLE